MTDPRICFVVSSPMTARAFLRGHIAQLSRRYGIDLVADTGGTDDLEDIETCAKIFPVHIRREIAPIVDLAALISLFLLFRRERYAIVSSVTPKAGMLALLAGALAGVPLRIHIFTGQVWVTRSSWRRAVLKAADRCMARLATHVLTDSKSQRDFMITEEITSADKIRVLGEGSICGVDSMRFAPDAVKCAGIRLAHGIPEAALVFLFLGRLTRDKGVLDLAEAFAAQNDNAWLLVVGPDEAFLRQEMERQLGPSLNRARFVGYTDRPEDFMAAADVLCLPSYREGFGMVIIEAAAAGIPAIGSRIYGVVDAIEENVTGLLHCAGDPAELAGLMAALAGDAVRRRAMGAAARARAQRLFSREAVTQSWLEFYRQLLG